MVITIKPQLSGLFAVYTRNGNGFVRFQGYLTASELVGKLALTLDNFTIELR
jgi:hypothetical protein